MKGNNTITVNKATMLAALQMYFEYQFSATTAEPFKVTDVRSEGSGNYFVININEDSDKDKPL